MKAIAEKYGLGPAILGSCWLVESVLNIGQIVASWF